MAEKTVDIPEGRRNEGIKEWLRSSVELRAALLGWAVKFTTAYKAEAPHKTGRLASSAVAGVEWSKYTNDRPIGTVKVRAPYAVWNLTGAGPGKHERSTGRMPRFGPFRGDFTFTRIANELRGS